ncbi:hydrogenase [Thermococcus sp. CX2]|uniref:NADH-quinone oxidoreductase subunit B family protein n=1 Tax=Thermococcus sp. CX2 TaxID=163006 RepID=UPI00143AA969|nr:NADH-quinone oxidoreductase subunit B family protein [Thermococcus sp. CX2]NJE84526.1 hydrogenase [Thermococcus sp. CX2]
MKRRSVWVFHVNSGSCNSCDFEILDVFTPYYDVRRMGIKLVGSPRHADALLVSGPLTRQTYYSVKAVYEAMPSKPRIVVAVGTCACSGGIFYDGYSIFNTCPSRGKDLLRTGGIEILLAEYGKKPDIYIPGCPPSPEEILYGLAQLVGIKEKKVRGESHIVSASDLLSSDMPVSERIYLLLREELRRVVGYFDRDDILEDFLRLVETSEKSENPKETLHQLVTEYTAKADDSRVKFAMKFLEREYLVIKDELEKNHMVLGKAHIL